MNLVKKLNEILANSYALYLKTQNYHWNVVGSNFIVLHKLFEKQYEETASEIDKIAEAIRMLDSKVAASFDIFERNSIIDAGDEEMDASSMLKDLLNGHVLFMKLLEEALNIAQETGDEFVADLIIERMRFHKMAIWQLSSTLAN